MSDGQWEDELQKEMDDLVYAYGITELLRCFIFSIAKKLDRTAENSYTERHNAVYQTLLLAQKLYNSRYVESDSDMHKAVLNTERNRIEKFEKENLKKLSSLEKFGE